MKQNKRYKLTSIKTEFTNKPTTNNKRYWKNLKENFGLLIPQGGFLIIQAAIISIGFSTIREAIEKVPDTYAKAFVLLVLIGALVKIITWFGLDSLNEYGKTWVKVMEKK